MTTTTTTRNIDDQRGRRDDMNATDTTFADRAIREASAVVSTDESRPVIQSVDLVAVDDGTRITATDSYVAVSTVVPLFLPDGVERMTYKPTSKPSWADAMVNGVEATVATAAYPNMEQIFKDPRGYRLGEVEPLGRRRYNEKPGDDAVGQWRYFDGTRRKPNGIVRLAVEDGTLTAKLGLKISDDKRLPTAVLWEGHTRDVAKITGDLGDGSYKVGDYNAKYLPALAWADTIRWDAEMRPLLVTVGRIEHLVMPIRGMGG